MIFATYSMDKGAAIELLAVVIKLMRYKVEKGTPVDDFLQKQQIYLIQQRVT